MEGRKASGTENSQEGLERLERENFSSPDTFKGEKIYFCGKGDKLVPKQ